ncbi:hypothetical protein COCVIDRAFT_40548 [Bipolaris victoriae FI3]|uniref:Uncharacterized protein n=1 Tax=Bipolaris victoriae (strain FI3) TaxID=930091 RepID=W7ED49_BIPV3|nr:hypothetical protein COCVIDRAFT_40548 [Bipolaris victoriae FI3]
MTTYTQQQTPSSINTLYTGPAQGQTSNPAKQYTALPPSSTSKKTYPTIFTLPHIGRELHPQELLDARNLTRAESSTTKNNNYSLYTNDSTATSTSTNTNPEYSISTLLQKLTTFLTNFFLRSHTNKNPSAATASNTPGSPQNHPHEPTFPPFLLPYTPAPSSYPSSSFSSGTESDKEPTREKQKQKQKQKRCWVGRPRGAILRPRDRYYARGLCDKHGSEGFWRICGFIMERKGWRCG